jgi:serine/threonine protein kinase
LVREASVEYTWVNETSASVRRSSALTTFRSVRSKHNLNYYAIKVLNKEKVVKAKQTEHTNNERATLLVVRHPFIINLWGSFQDTANLYLVMDYVPGGELFTLIRKSSVRSSAGPTWVPYHARSNTRIPKIVNRDFPIP